MDNKRYQKPSKGVERGKKIIKQHEETQRKELIQLNEANREIDQWTAAFFVGTAVLLFILFLINLPSIYAAVLGTSAKREAQSITLPIQSPTSDPTPTLTPTTVPKVYVPIPTTDPDPLVTCNYQHLGPQKIRSSLCNTQLECEIDGKWYFYPSLNSCKQAQNNYWEIYRSRNTYTPPATTQNIPTSEPSVSCVLSYGTYQFLQSDCEDAKQRDKEDQERKQEQDAQNAIRSLERQYEQYQEEEQRKTNLLNCLQGANKKLEECGTIASGSELAGQACASSYTQVTNQCHALYGY